MLLGNRGRIKTPDLKVCEDRGSSEDELEDEGESEKMQETSNYRFGG
jgi:hypothetical protein